MSIIKYKKEIIISLIVGVFLIYLTPFLNYIGNLLIDFFLILSEKFSNDYYKQIAENYENKFSERNNFILSLFFIAGLYILNLDTYRSMKNMKSKVDESLANIEERINYLNNPEEIKKTKDELLSELSDKQNRLIALKDKYFKKDKPNKFGFILLIIIFITFFANSAINRSVMQANNDFKNNLKIIAPYFDQNKLTKFRSEWALIENANDYNKIKEEIEILKTKIK